MKKILAIILSLVIFTSMATVSFAAVTPVVNTLKSFTFTSESLPNGFLGTYNSNTITRALDGSEGVLSVTTNSGDYNLYFVNASNALAVEGEFALCYDVKVISVAENFSASNPVVNPHIMYSGTGGYIDQSFLPSAYLDRENGKIIFKASAAATNENNFTNHSSFTGELNKWYTVKYVINPLGSIKTYVIDRETGNRAFISEKTGFTMNGLTRFNFTARGNASYYMDNIKIYSGIATQSSFAVNSFDTLQGLAATVSLADNVKKAELLANGTVIETIQNSGSGTYKIANENIKSTVREYDFSLVCYDSNNTVTETISKSVSPELKVYNSLASSQAEETISNGTQKIEHIVKTAAVIEVSMDIKFNSGCSSVKLEPRFYNASGAQKYGGSGTWTPILSSGTIPVIGGAFDADKWYKVRTIYDSVNFVTETYMDAGNGEVLVHSGKMDTDYKLGYYITGFQMTGGTSAVIKNKYVKEIKSVSAPFISSYTGFNGEQVATFDKVPSSAKGVSLNLGEITLSNEAQIKVYKNGEEVSGTTFSPSGNSVALNIPSLSEGKYEVAVSGTAYASTPTNLTFVNEFEVEETFGILSPTDGASLSSDAFDIAVSTLSCEKLEIYANDVLKDTKENPASIYTYNYTPENFGSVKIDAVATLSDGTKETDTVFVDVSGKVLTYDAIRTIGYSGSGFTKTTTDIKDFYGNDANYFSAAAGAANSNCGNIYTSTVGKLTDAAINAGGEVHLKFNIKIDDASALSLRSEIKSYKADGTTSTFDPYPMNSKYMFEYGAITKRPASLKETYTYEDGKWYEVEYVIDMKDKKQSAFIKDLQSGTVTTLADNINVIKSSFGTLDEGELLPDGYGIETFKFNLAKAATTETTGFTISNIDVKNYEDVPVMGDITYGEKVSSNGMIEECSSVNIALSNNLYNSDLASFVTLTKNGKAEEALITYSNGVITVTPAKGFVKNNRYQVTISGDAQVLDKNINIPVTKEITVSEDGLFISPAVISKGTNEGDYNAEISYYNYSEETEDGVLVLASYTGDKMTNISLSSKNKIYKGYGMLNASISGVVKGEKVKVMLWNNTSGLVPMVDGLEIIAE